MRIATTERQLERTRILIVGAAITIATLCASVIIAGSARAASGDFTDVPTSHKFGTEIAWLADQQITTGYSDGSFRPRDSVSREAFAAFLYRMAGKPGVDLPSRSPFSDVPKSAQFYKEIVWLSETGITNGWSDGTFRPKDKISREAIAAFLYRFEGRPSFNSPSRSPFSDMSTRSQFYKEVTWLSKTGMTTGYADGTFRPKANVSREAIAAFLYRGNTVLRSNGTFRVGSHVQPGVYTAVPARDRYSSLCYWERRDSSGTSFDGIIANEASEYRTIVEIASSDAYFHTDGCSGWSPLRKVSPSATTVGDGTHAVGYHLRPGLYTASGGHGCYWEVVSDFSGDFDSIVENEYIDGRPAEVRLYDGQGFTAEDCGTWRRIAS